MCSLPNMMSSAGLRTRAKIISAFYFFASPKRDDRFMQLRSDRLSHVPDIPPINVRNEAFYQQGPFFNVCIFLRNDEMRL
jgi:hypothetical protein